MNLNLNLKEFLKYLNRFKWLAILIPIVCAVLTYFYVQSLPKKYKSEALIYTGITKQFDQAAINNGQSLDYFKLTQQFGNLLEMMKSKQIINGLSYKLILHDLKDPAHPFQIYPDIVKKLSSEEKQIAINEYEKRYNSNILISTADNGRIKLYDILGASGYNEDNILKNLSIARNGESDFIKVTYVSPNPDLSAFVVNNLSNDFILYYSNLSMAGQRKSLTILDSLVAQKRNELSRKNAEIQSTSAASAAAAANNLNVQKRSDIALQELVEAQTQRSQVIRNISSTEGALNEVNRKLNGTGGYLKQDAVEDNSEVINIDNQLQIANRKYINNNFKAEDRAVIDSLQRIKSRLIANSSNRLNTNNAVLLKQQLTDQKIKLENDLASYKSALSTIDQQINVLNSKATGVAAAPSVIDANQQLLTNDADLVAKDYANAQAQYDQALMLIKTGVKLTLAAPGLPGPPEPSKNILFVASSGIASLLICLMTLFFTFMLNNTVSSPDRLESYTHLKVIGSLNYISEQNKYLRDIWEDNGDVKNYSIYKDNLRSLRFELNKYLNEASTILGITSLTKDAGKTFLAGSLSYAFAMMGKNVLLICEKDTTLNDLLSRNVKKTDITQKFESFLVKKQIQIEDRITILNRNPTNTSLLELRDNRSLVSGFKILKDTFDIIIIDIDSAESVHLVKEWLMFCDKSICVFNSGDKINENDKLFIEYLSSQKGFLGWVLNKIKIKK